MKVVLDTNVIVSAFLSPFGKPAVILRAVIKQNFGICFNTAILTEYEQVLIRSKFAGKIHEAEVRRFFEIINDFGTQVISLPSKKALLDESDRIFYDVAKTSGAALITGNKKHYPNEPFIFSPAEFLDSLHNL